MMAMMNRSTWNICTAVHVFQGHRTRPFTTTTVLLFVICILQLLLLQVPNTVEAFTIVKSLSQRASSSSSSSLCMSSISSSSNEPPPPSPDITTTATMTPTVTSTTNDIEANVYMKNLIQSRWMELPASSLSLLQKRQAQQNEPPLEVFEQMIGRIAMMGAIGILMRECYDGQSIVEQVMNMV